MGDRSGSFFNVSVQDQAGRKLGTVSLDTDAVLESYKSGDPGAEPVSAGSLRAAMPQVLAWLASRVRADIPLAIHFAVRSAIPVRKSEHDSPHQDAAAVNTALDRARLGLAGNDLHAVLDLPASEVIPERPRISVERGLNPPTISLAEFLAAAIESGDGAALDAVQRWLRQRGVRGAKAEDWPTILTAYADAREQLHRLAAILRDAADDEADVIHSHLEIYKRVTHAGLGTALRRRPVRWVALAKTLIAKEYRISEATLIQRWKDREQLLVGTNSQRK